MTEHITGRQARELLDGTTPGPWQAYDPGDGTARLYGDMNTCHYPEYDEDSRGVHLIHAVNGDWNAAASAYLKRPDGELIAAAPDLAETVAWLYGRKPGRDGAHRIGGRTIRPAGDYVEMDGYEMRPETAVDLARGLLAAAEEARRG